MGNNQRQAPYSAVGSPDKVSEPVGLCLPMTRDWHTAWQPNTYSRHATPPSDPSNCPTFTEVQCCSPHPQSRSALNNQLHGPQTFISLRPSSPPPHVPYNNNNNKLLLLLSLSSSSLTAVGLSPGGSGYFTCIQNMKLVTNKFKLGGLHEKHVVATWNLGNLLSF